MQIILNKITELNLNHLNLIIGADMNSDVATLIDYSSRFQNLQSAGFEILWVNKMTNVNMDQGQEAKQQREIDCILYRPAPKQAKRGFLGASLEKIGALRKPLALLGNGADILEGFGDLRVNQISDHRPVYAEFLWVKNN